MVDDTTDGRAPNYLRLDPFQNVVDVHWPKKHGEPSEEPHSEYEGWWIWPGPQTITTYIWVAPSPGHWAVLFTNPYGYETLGQAIAHGVACGPFTAGAAAMAMGIYNGWVAAYNSLGAYPAIEFSMPPYGDPANAYVAGLGISSTGGDASHGYGGGSEVITFPYLDKMDSRPTFLKPYG